MPNIVPHLPANEILAAYETAGGNEIESGKFESPRSSSALAANAFGFFITGAHKLPPFPVWPNMSPFHEVRLEAEMRFPWRGGKHPWLDVAAKSIDSLVGVEAKRFEPFEGRKKVNFVDTYWRDVWGDNLVGYQAMRDGLKAGEIKFKYLGAAQLVKHAFGLRSQANKRGLIPYLLYLYAEPTAYPNGRFIAAADNAAHREEIRQFAAAVKGDEVRFMSMSYDELLTACEKYEGLRFHASQIRQHFL
jgi:hypothetical protein